MTRYIVGLGNPGPQYANTRHNAGFWLVDHLAELLGVSFRKPWFRPFLLAQVDHEGDTMILLKPLSFMNQSAVALRPLLALGRLSAPDILVVFDQMDLPPGRAKLKLRGGSAGHNGLKSLDALFHPESYARLAIGIGRNRETDVVSYVLGSPSEEDLAQIDRACRQAATLLAQRWALGWEALIHGINSITTASETLATAVDPSPDRS
jgi:PTH1 family peptidyl-tRNA hydrolase